MQQFDEYRKNLVECQLYPNGILDRDILEIFRTLPREVFYSADKAVKCYGDEDIPLKDNIWALEPVTEARIVYHGDFRRDDVVLVVGAATPTLPAYLAHLVTTVIVIDTDAEMLETIKNAALKLELCNIVTEQVADMAQGFAAQAPFDRIVFGGAIAHIPPALQEQLVDGGGLVAVERESERAPGVLNVYIKSQSGYLSPRFIGHANTPYLPPFAPEEKFVF